MLRNPEAKKITGRQGIEEEGLNREEMRLPSIFVHHHLSNSSSREEKKVYIEENNEKGGVHVRRSKLFHHEL